MSRVEKTEKKGLDLVPNEIVGYRISPEPHNWTVVLVKKKANGTEYKTPLTFHKHLSSAISWIYNTVAQNEGKTLQNISQEINGVAADLSVLNVAFNRGLEEALKAVECLEVELVANGFDPKHLSSSAYEKITGNTATLLTSSPP